MSDMFTCFGYGSLVNSRTLPDDSLSARVKVTGWRRAWRLSVDTKKGRRCTLTVIPDPTCAIFGTVVAQPQTQIEVMQKREAVYDRIDLSPDAVEWIDARPDGWPDPYIHVGDSAYARTGDRDHPVLLSYVETVLAGYLQTFGSDGPDHFIETTADWHVPVLNDRESPIYSRATELSVAERALVDELLERAGVELIELQPS